MKAADQRFPLMLYKSHQSAARQSGLAMGKITFYEERSFSGRHLQCGGDCPDLTGDLRRCGSVRVESGGFVLYDQPNYRGGQVYLRRGAYPDFLQWAGPHQGLGSCRLVPTEAGSFSVRLYERIEFGGEAMDLVDDCPSVMERFHVNDVFSCHVTGGHWLFYEQPGYRGCMYLVPPGEYKRFSEWGGRTARVGSIRRILDM